MRQSWFRNGVADRPKLALACAVAATVVVSSSLRESRNARRSLLVSEVDEEPYACEDLTFSESCYAGGDRVFEVNVQACATCGFSSKAATVRHWYDCVSCHAGATIVPLYDDCSGACVREEDAEAFSRTFGGAVLAQSACSRLRACYDVDDAELSGGNDVFPFVVPRSEWRPEWDRLLNATDDAPADEPVEDGYDDDYLDWLVLPAELEWYEDWRVSADDVPPTPDLDSWLARATRTAREALLAAFGRVEFLQGAIDALFNP